MTSPGSKNNELTLSKEDIFFVKSIAKSLISPHSPDFDDLVQEGSIAFLRALATYDENKASFRTYAARCVKNAMLDYLRKKTRLNMRELAETWEYYPLKEPDDILDLKIELEALKEKLTDTERKALDAVLLCGSIKNASSHLNWHPKKLENAITRIKKKAQRA
jgi:RNA polymerase sporulation-specific sigma factor